MLNYSLYCNVNKSKYWSHVWIHIIWPLTTRKHPAVVATNYDNNVMLLPNSQQQLRNWYEYSIPHFLKQTQLRVTLHILPVLIYAYIETGALFGSKTIYLLFLCALLISGEHWPVKSHVQKTCRRTTSDKHPNNEHTMAFSENQKCHC